MWSNKMCGLFGAVALALLAGATSASITIATVPVGNPGNAPEDDIGVGEVDYAYNIGKYDVTAGQYTAFLNAVAQTDPYGLYNSHLANDYAACGITQSGSPGSYTYTTTKNANFPVNYMSWGDAARFCNWLTNGQPTGAEGNGTTETGSYTLNGAVTDAALEAVTRNANADYVIPTENEWYKAAYYNPTGGFYYTYATSNDDLPSHVLSATGTNNANYYAGGYVDPTNYLTPVGAFADSVSPYGTFDQNGDVFQWDESSVSGVYLGLRGGAFDFTLTYMESDTSSYFDYPSEINSAYGFRVAQVPEPASLGLLGIGCVGMLGGRRRVRK